MVPTLPSGTMGSESAPALPEADKGRLFTLEKGEVRVADDRPTQISNGLAWSAGDTVMYFIDSLPRHVYAYDYDAANGTIGNVMGVTYFMLILRLN